MAITQDELLGLANNPSRGINRIIGEIESAWFNGQSQLNSKSHPAVLCMDLIIGTSHGVLNRIDDAVSKVALLHARNMADLSRNMGDEEKVGLYGNPSFSTLTLGIEENTLRNISKPMTVINGNIQLTYQTLLIPKDTEISFNGYVFAIENGIQIRYSETSGYQVVYDDETNSPFNPISNNLLNRYFRVSNDRRYFMIDIPVRQVECIPSENLTANVGSGCSGQITYRDNLYGVRAMLTTANGTREIRVTFDQQAFDPKVVTLALDLDSVNSMFKYEIPDVYIQNGLGIGTVRIYTYVTKGAMEKDLRDISSDAITVNYQDYRYGVGQLGYFSDMLRNSSGVLWGMSDIVSGGSNPVDFDTLKQSLVRDRYTRTLPITENNLQGMVEQYGYSAVKTIDYLTRRTYSVTRDLPVQDNKSLTAPMSCFVGSYMASANGLVGSGVVKDNGKRITIPHNVLFDITKPTLQLVNQITKDQYMGMSDEAKIELLGDKSLVYTPFYYVMDMTNNQAVLRTYHLDQPVLNYQTFINENPSLGIEVGVGSIALDHKEDGYLLTIVTKSGKSYQELDNSTLGLQLSIQSEGSTSLSSIAGTLEAINQDNERVWTFKLESSFDIDVADILYFNNFTQFGQVRDGIGTKLTTELTLIFTFASQVTGVTTSDLKIDQTLFNQPMISIIETHYNATFGRALGNFYSRIRPLVGEAQYLRYDHDVPARYTENTYKRNGSGQLLLPPQLEHQAGDIMYTSAGNVILQNRKGDVVYEDGQPVMLAPRDLQYHWDFIGFDATYYFSEDDYDAAFAGLTKNYFLNVIAKDMEAFSSSSLDMTRLFYQPRNKMGYQKVVVNSNQVTSLRHDLSFTVTYYLTYAGFRNQNLKDSLTKNTPSIINKELYSTTTVSTDALVDALRENGSTEVVGVKVSALSGDSTIDVISNVDNLSGFSVRKILESTGNGVLSVREDIGVVFMPHDVRMVDAGPGA